MTAKIKNQDVKKSRVTGAGALVSKDDLVRMRMRQLCSVFALADTTLAGLRVKATAVDQYTMGSDAPASSSRGTITFNLDRIPDVTTVEGLVKVNGLNYHELAHILYTPQGGPLVRRINMAGNFPAFNVLEDQRIETLLVARYPSVRPYLVATIAEYFVHTDPKSHDGTWPFLYGRKYLPRAMRTYFRDRAYGVPNMDLTMRVAERIIDEYVLLNVHDPANHDRAYELVDKFQTIIGSAPTVDPFGHQQGGTCVEGGTGSGDATPARQRKQEKDTQDAIDAAQDAQDGADDTQDGQDDAQGAGDQGDDGDGGDTGTVDDGQGGDGGGADGDGDQDGDGAGRGADSDTASGDGGGDGVGGGGGGIPADPDQVSDWLKNMADAAANDPNIAEDVRRQREALGVGGRYRGGLDAPKRQERSVSMDAKRLARQFGKQLQRLVTDSDPGWHTHQTTGKINVQRIAQGAGADDAFDMWDAGKQDADSIEMVIMADTSGSMGHIVDAVMESLWIIKAGVETLGNSATVSVIEFESTARYVYKPGERAKRDRVRVARGGGSTHPWSGIEEALRIFQASRKARKIMVFISDGAWMEQYRNGDYTQGDENDHAIDRMNAHGITTAAVYINKTRGLLVGGSDPDVDDMARHHGHGCKVFALIDSTEDLVQFGKALVTAAIRK